jgi:AraC family ethanolamine operon transcriptional activator
MPTMGRSISINTCRLDSFEGLHQAIRGSHVEVTQLGRGRFRGALSHVGIGDFSLSIGSFSVGVRTQRIATDDRLVIGMLLNASERVTHWSFDMVPADVLVMPPSTEHDGSFHGAAAYAAIRLDLAEVTSLFAGEPRLSDPRPGAGKTVIGRVHRRAWPRRSDCSRSSPAWRGSRPA